MARQHHRTQDETIRLILHVVSQSQEPMTRAAICAAIGRHKTPHLIALIDGLVAAGYLHRSVKTFHNGVQGYVYQMKR
ncbi:MAG: winged helix DNA-binding protein [Anaerolineae bacterium]|nr:winged helix DNA-binding protein [Anaerolineae bacterium]MDW8170901.1 winged helix DNA-binding protein [Anaerolineae bacterium]